MHLNIWYIILQTRMYNTLQYRHRKSSYYFTMTLVIVPILHLCHGGFILLHIFSLHWRVPFSQSAIRDILIYLLLSHVISPPI